jgi:hypothetical protein
MLTPAAHLLARLPTIATIIGLAGCSLIRGAANAPLAGSLSELRPHGDRDHFVYIWQKVADGKRLAEGIQVEHVQCAPESDEFDVVLSENGTPIGRQRLEDDGQELTLLREDDLGEQLGVTFAPGLTQLEIPLMAGEYRDESTATLTSLSRQATITAVEVSQVVRVIAAKGITSGVGDFPRGVAVETERTMHWPWGDTAFTASVMLVPGVGEIRSEVRAGENFVTRRELACAIVGGRSIGDCGAVDAKIEEMRDAGSTDVR